MRDRCISKKASDRFRYCYRFIVVEFREVALRSGLRAAWSQPIVSKDNEVLGTFCVYYPEPRTPSPSDILLIEAAAPIALVAIERERSTVTGKGVLSRSRSGE